MNPVVVPVAASPELPRELPQSITGRINYNVNRVSCQMVPSAAS